MPRPRRLRRTRCNDFFRRVWAHSLGMQACRLCEILTPEIDGTCVFCRVRNRFWHSLDRLPVRARGWAINNLRVWTGVIEEESDKFEEAESAKRAAEATTAPKSAPASKSGSTPREGSVEEPTNQPDKSWISPKKEEVRRGEKPSPRGLVDVESAEEGKTSSASKPAKEERKASRKRSRSDRRRERSRSRRSKRDRSRSRRSRHKERRSRSRRDHRGERREEGGGKERKAKPSVRPPKTPSRSPPRDRGGPPPKEPPVRRGGPPDPVPRPTGRGWSGPIKAWHRAPQYWGVNKGQKKKENQYYYRR